MLNTYTVLSGADSGLVRPEAYTYFGVISKNKNSKLRIQN